MPNSFSKFDNIISISVGFVVRLDSIFILVFLLSSLTSLDVLCP